MMLKKLYTDEAYIVDENGDRSGPYKTRFGSGNTLTFLDETLEIVVGVGYKIIQPLDDGEELSFQVIEYDFQERINRIPPQHIVKIEKKHKPDKETAVPVQKSADKPEASPVVEQVHTVNIPESLVELIDRINSGEYTPEEKEEAKNAMKKLIENPAVSAILGDAAHGLLFLL